MPPFNKPARISLAEYRSKHRRQSEKAKKESAVQAEVCALLHTLGIRHAVTDASASFNARGERRTRVTRHWPDVTACLAPHGRLLAIECKRPVNGRLSYGQAVLLRDLEQQGALVVIPRSAGELWDAIQANETPASTLAEIETTLAKGPAKTARRGSRGKRTQGNL